MDVLRNMKFEVEEFGVNSIIVKAHPTWLPKDNEELSIKKIIEVLVREEKNFSIVKFNEK